MTCNHIYSRCQYITLTLPDSQGDYELSQLFFCDCGHTRHTVCLSRGQGRHHDLETLLYIIKEERRLEKPVKRRESRAV